MMNRDAVFYTAVLTCDLEGGPDVGSTCRRLHKRKVSRRCACVHVSSDCRTWWTDDDTCRKWTAYDVCTFTDNRNIYEQGPE